MSINSKDGLVDNKNSAKNGLIDPKRHVDACGIIGGIRQDGDWSLSQIAEKLGTMKHRGQDGVGVYFRLKEADLNKEIASAKYKADGIAELPVDAKPLILMTQVPEGYEQAGLGKIRTELLEKNLDFLYAKPISLPTEDGEKVVMWRIVAVDPQYHEKETPKKMLGIKHELVKKVANKKIPTESFYPASFSDQMMVLYKLNGQMEQFLKSYNSKGELAQQKTDLFLSHIRYSTNTLPMHRAAQPFDGIAHNGEINTIRAIRRAMQDFGIPLSGALSDSADLGALVEHLIVYTGLTLTDTLQLLFPPLWYRRRQEHKEISEADEKALAEYYKSQFMRLTAEGPVALIVADGKRNRLIGRRDNMGLRPLWEVKTLDGEVYYTSEPGAVGSMDNWVSIRPLRPGEILAAEKNVDSGEIKIYSHADLQAELHRNMLHKIKTGEAVRDKTGKIFTCPAEIQQQAIESAQVKVDLSILKDANLKAAGLVTDRLQKLVSKGKMDAKKANTLYNFINGQTKRVTQRLTQLRKIGKERTSGTGSRTGLYACYRYMLRLSELWKDVVDQVTAPTISTEHEMGTMDLSVRLGRRSEILTGRAPNGKYYKVKPVLLGCDEATGQGKAFFGALANQLDTITIDELFHPTTEGAPKAKRIDTTINVFDARFKGAEQKRDSAKTNFRAEIERICEEAEVIAEDGEYGIIVLDDARAFTAAGLVGIPPELLVGAIDEYLKNKGLRHKIQIVVKSEEICDQHAIFTLYQLGADAVAPTKLVRDQFGFGKDAKGKDLVQNCLRFFKGLNDSLAIRLGRIATNRWEANIGGRRNMLIGLNDYICNLLGIEQGIKVGDGVGFGRILQAMQTKAKAMLDTLDEELEEKEVDTMPEDISLARYAILGGIANQDVLKGKKLETVWQVLTDIEVVSGKFSEIKARGDIEQISKKTDTEIDEILQAIFAKLRERSPYTFLDSVVFDRALVNEGKQSTKRAKNWERIKSGLDGLSLNQIIGAISYGANGATAHEMYARTMAELGGVSNGGEGGVPEFDRALYITARFKQDGGKNTKALKILLEEEIPRFCSQLQGSGPDWVDILMRKVPEDFADHRFEQISTGRFGIDAYALLDTKLVEIKIGQGAKPGIGGSLPGEKVKAEIAYTRNVNVGQTLNSPTVHHDIYSIEDLSQLVTAIKTLNPSAKVSIKLAAMDNLDIVALGVAKAGADFIYIDGYEGGTASSQPDHKEHCGPPGATIVNKVHKVLEKEGLRGAYCHRENNQKISRSEYHRLSTTEQSDFEWRGIRLIAGGGIRDSVDALKMTLAGADFISYGDLAQNLVGCIRCDACSTGGCPCGITTIQDEKFKKKINEETLRRGIQTLDIGIRRLAAQLDPEIANIEELVGRTDLLEPLIKDPEQSRLRPDRGFFKQVLTTITDIVKKTQSDVRELLAREVNQKIQTDFKDWEKLIKGILNYQKIDDILKLAKSGVKLPDHLLDLKIDVRADNQDRLLGTNIVRDFIHLRRLVKMITGQNLKVTMHADGAAGNGAAMFGVHGMEYIFTGLVQDGFVEAGNGVKAFILPRKNRDGNIIKGSGSTGNTPTYGLIDGEIHIAGEVGTRTAVRFSGGSLFLWGGNSDDVRLSFESNRPERQFLAEFATCGTIVMCSDPGENILSATTGQNTELLCRKPNNLSRDVYAENLLNRIPPNQRDNFEAVTLEDRHVDLINQGQRDMTEKAQAADINDPITPLADNENVRDTFVLIREKRKQEK